MTHWKEERCGGDGVKEENVPESTKGQQLEFKRRAPSPTIHCFAVNTSASCFPAARQQIPTALLF